MMRENLLKWLKNNEVAIQLILTLHSIVEIWDDLRDRDKIVQEQELNGAFYAALIELPRNPFYQQHFMMLSPIVEAAIFDWYAANSLEDKRDVESLRSAYILRCSGLQLTIMCARIIGGPDWAARVSAEIRGLGDTWPEYASKHGVTNEMVKH